jgi:hypothetical protein
LPAPRNSSAKPAGSSKSRAAADRVQLDAPVVRGANEIRDVLREGRQLRTLALLATRMPSVEPFPR